jgi:hypothetical protein
MALPRHMTVRSFTVSEAQAILQEISGLPPINFNMWFRKIAPLPIGEKRSGVTFLTGFEVYRLELALRLTAAPPSEALQVAIQTTGGRFNEPPKPKETAVFATADSRFVETFLGKLPAHYWPQKKLDGKQLIPIFLLYARIEEAVRERLKGNF